MKIYNDKHDKIAKPTKRTFSVVSVGQVRYDVIGDATTIRLNGRHDYSLYFVENGVVYFDKITKVEDEVVCNSSDQSPAATSLARERIAFFYALSYNRDVRKSAG